MEENVLKLLWAKSEPYQSLQDHMTAAGLCAGELMAAGVADAAARTIRDAYGLTEEETRNLIMFLSAMHDIGKCHPFFQAKCETEKTAGLINLGMLHRSLPKDEVRAFRHELCSERVFLDCINARTDETEAWEAFARVLSLHHQGKGRHQETRVPSACAPGKWREAQQALFCLMEERFSPPLEKIGAAHNIDAALQELLGIIILSDWIASGETGQEEITGALLSAAVAARGLAKEERLLPSESFHTLFPEIPPEGMRGIQKAADEQGRSGAAKLYLVEAPMGEGKSETALYLAACQMRSCGKNGLYMAMPTAATGNQMYFRLNALLEAHGFKKSRLLHSTAWIVDANTPETAETGDPEARATLETAQEWLAPLKRGLLSQYAVGTVDQAMLSVMDVRYGAVRLLGLSGKVLVFDEIHAYDTYMRTIIESLLGWLKRMDVPVILLSATLPMSKKQSLLKAYGAERAETLSDAYPLITAVGADGRISEIPVKTVHMHRNYHLSSVPYLHDAEKTAALALSMTENGGCICLLVNTVKRAQNVYALLKASGFGGELMLFHARFPAGRRQEIEKTVTGMFGKTAKNRPEKCIVVATQVMEQSIDADFDAMITDIAPVDLLFQRMGRVHRFEGTVRSASMQTPVITVLTSENGYEREIYAPSLLKRTEAWLEGRKEACTPGEIRPAVEEVYAADTPEDEELFMLWKKERFKAEYDTAEAEACLLPPPGDDTPSLLSWEPSYRNGENNGSPKTRQGEDTELVALMSPAEIEKLQRRCSKAEAQEVLLRTAPVRTEPMGAPPEGAARPGGLLKGVLLLPAESHSARWGKYTVTEDNELGILIEKEA